MKTLDPNDYIALHNEANRLLGINRRLKREEPPVRTIYDKDVEEYGRLNRWQETARNR